MTIFEYTKYLLSVSSKIIMEARQFPVTVSSSFAPINKRLSGYVLR